MKVKSLIKYILFISFCFTSIVCRANEESTTQKINKLIRTTDSYRLKDADSTLKYAKLSLSMLKSPDCSTELQLKIYESVGNAYRSVNNNMEALYFYTLGFLIADTNNIESYILSLRNSIGGVYYDNGMYETALNVFLNQLEIAQKSYNPKAVSVAYNQLGIVYSKLGDYKTALDYFGKAIDIKEKIGDSIGITVSYYNIAGNFYQQEKYDEALAYYLQVEDFFIEKDLAGHLMKTQYKIASVYESMGDIRNAKSYCYKLLAYSEKNNEYNYREKAYSKLSNLYKAEKNYVKALEMNDLMLEVTDSLKKTVYQGRNRVEEIEKTKKEIENLENLQEINNKTWCIIGIIFITLVIIILFIYRLYTANRKTNHLLEEKINERTNELRQAFIEQEQLKLKAEESTRLKSAFLANVSHEIRTPLNSIVGFSEILCTEDDLSLAEATEYKAIIQRNSVQLLDLINDILDFSRIESSGVDLNPQEFDFVILLNDIGRFSKTKAKSGVEVIVNNPYNKFVVTLDRTRCAQVINNIMHNGLKFTEKGSVSISIEHKEPGVYIVIRDTGIGIPEEAIATLFDRFEKVNTFAEGTGLGLPICRAIVTAMGGTISVDSKQGEGANFYISIPCKVESTLRS